MQLTPHFADRELGVIGCDRHIIDNATYLCVLLLEPIRQHFNTAVNIHDGYRDTGHNSRVGGKPASFHLFSGGKAACDFDVHGHSYKEVFDWIRLRSLLPFDKIILENTTAGIPAALHIQIDRGAAPRREAYVGNVGDSKFYTLVETR